MEVQRAAASDQKVVAGCTRLIRMKKQPKPHPASTASPIPCGGSVVRSGHAISPIESPASTKPPNCSSVGSPAVNALKRTGSAAVNTAETGAAMPILPLARAV